ncbi:MAG TPA: Uma2 family endonuclease [Verrucomicrobium sp.]|nr:Uma2 family endonuclease [Verrucomicrobium sp.]
MALPKPQVYFTPEEYYALERQTEEKNEYFQGEIFAMSGSTTRHARIGTNLLGELHASLKGKRCTPLNGDQRIKVSASGLRTYPDASVFCGPMEYDPEDSQRDTATNPTMLFEVLSDSTEGYDRGRKSENYRKIVSLQAYALISQDRPHIELFERQEDEHWRLTEASGTTASLALACIGVNLRLEDVYSGVEFDEIPSLTRVKEDVLRYRSETR